MGDGHDSAAAARSEGVPAVAWDEARAAWWLAGAEEREKQLLPVSDALFARAALQPGEHVLDVGVGSGPTSRQAWNSVQPGGSVTGVDIAAPMIAAARQQDHGAEIDWIVGDAATQDFTPGRYDAVISRFGVMFFTDPVAAFSNLRSATRIGGRLVITVWSQLFAAGLFAIPYTVATTTLHRLEVPYRDFPADGILFSLGRPGLAQSVLEAAGWTDVEVSVDNRPLHLPPDAHVAAKLTLAAGPVQMILEGQSDSVRAEVEEALVADFDHRRETSGISLPAGFLVASARHQ
jgi:SAM-dependent methyltransferase